MSEVTSNDMKKISKNFVKKNKDEFFYYNHNLQNRTYRNLQASEIETLVKNNNSAENWNDIFVTDSFNPNLVVNTEFYGRVYLGDLTNKYLEYNDLRLPVGIYNSLIFSCEIGDNVAIRNVNYLAHYIIGDECILFNIDEMITSDRSKFGNGILKEDEDESIRIRIEIANENGGRWVLPFEGMLPSDAYLWSRHRDDEVLMNRFVEITDGMFDKHRGWYGTVGDKCVIKHCRIIKDAKIGGSAYIKGANKIKNITIQSSAAEPSQIGEGVELVNGIVGYSSKIFYGSKAVRFIMGRNTQLKYGARLINSILGDNSTISCCELLNNLIYPFHEQHHNNSFLIAATIQGQSNIAAGATIGSNHNSRAADGEIFAERGFWPGLCSNFKHNCKFAAFVLVAKGTYSYEMNITYPFSLVSSVAGEDSISIMPGYWFLYNMYAMERNNYKFRKRDMRLIKEQHIDLEYLAPDTSSEMLNSLNRITMLLATQHPELDVNLNQSEEDTLTVFDKDAMNKYGAVIKNPVRAINIYHKMLRYYAAISIASYYDIKTMNAGKILTELRNLKKNTPLYTEWENVGGQLIASENVKTLLSKIKNKTFNSWNDIHAEYAALQKEYPILKMRHCIHILENTVTSDIDKWSEDELKELMVGSTSIKKYIYKMAYTSREKDYENQFKRMTYLNEKEMKTVLGDIKDNDFLNNLRDQTEEYAALVSDFIKRVR